MRAGRRLLAGGGDGGRRPARRWGSPWASSTSTPTPTSTRPRPRPPASCTAWPWPSPWAAGRRRWCDATGAARRPGPEHVALSASAHLDPGERAALGELGLALPAAAARRAGHDAPPRPWPSTRVGNDDGPLVVHLDVDVIDPRRCRPRARSRPAKASALRRGLGPASPRSWPRRAWSRWRSAEYEPDRDPDGGLTPAAHRRPDRPRRRAPPRARPRHGAADSRARRPCRSPR